MNNKKEKKSKHFPPCAHQDFIVSVVLTLLWLISSCAWAQGVTDVKMYTDPDGGSVFDLMTECGVTPLNDHCQTVNIGNFASLNVSIVS